MKQTDVSPILLGLQQCIVHGALMTLITATLAPNTMTFSIAYLSTKCLYISVQSVNLSLNIKIVYIVIIYVKALLISDDSGSVRVGVWLRQGVMARLLRTCFPGWDLHDTRLLNNIIR